MVNLWFVKRIWNEREAFADFDLKGEFVCFMYLSLSQQPRKGRDFSRPGTLWKCYSIKVMPFQSSKVTVSTPARHHHPWCIDLSYVYCCIYTLCSLAQLSYFLSSLKETSALLAIFLLSLGCLNKCTDHLWYQYVSGIKRIASDQLDIPFNRYLVKLLVCSWARTLSHFHSPKLWWYPYLFMST